MTISEKRDTYDRIMAYLATPLRQDLGEKPLYPTRQQAADKFKYSGTHIYRIIKRFSKPTL